MTKLRLLLSVCNVLAAPLAVSVAGSDVEKNIDDSKSYGGRVSARFKPISTFSIRLAAIPKDPDSSAASVAACQA